MSSGLLVGSWTVYMPRWDSVGGVAEIQAAATVLQIRTVLEKRYQPILPRLHLSVLRGPMLALFATRMSISSSDSPTRVCLSKLILCWRGSALSLRSHGRCGSSSSFYGVT